MKKGIVLMTVACALLTASFANAQTTAPAPVSKTAKAAATVPAAKSAPVAKSTAKEVKAVKPATKEAAKSVK